MIINLGILNKAFKEGDVVSIDSLLKKQLISRIKGVVPRVKILGDGEINKKLSFKGLEMSQNAKKKIIKTGGTIS